MDSLRAKFSQIDSAVKDVQTQIFKLARKARKTDGDFAKLEALHAREEQLQSERESVQWDLESESEA